MKNRMSEVGKGKKSEGRGRRTEIGSQRPEVGGKKGRDQISGDRGRKGKADGRGMMDEEDQEVGCQRPEVGEKTEGRGTRDDRCARMRDDEEPDVGSRKGQEIRGKRAEIRLKRPEIGGQRVALTAARGRIFQRFG